MKQSKGRLDIHLNNKGWKRWTQLSDAHEVLRSLQTFPSQPFGWRVGISVFATLKLRFSSGLAERRMNPHLSKMCHSTLKQRLNIFRANGKSCGIVSLRPWLAVMSPGVNPGNMVFTGQELRQLTWKRGNKAPGPDGWRPAEWLCLPMKLFDALAELWACCLQHGRIAGV